MSKVPAEWTGVIEVDGEELDCRLFSASGRAKPFPLRSIHIKCKTPLDIVQEPKKGKRKKARVEVKEPSVVEVREQLYCPACNIALKTDEIGRAIETDAGLIPLTEAEIESLEFKAKKRVKAEFINVNDPSIAAIGIGRRLYVFPKPASLQTYFNVFHILKESNAAGFISSFVIKGTVYSAMIRPLSIPKAIFGAPRRVLIVDVLGDSDTLKDPAVFPDFPREIPSPDVSKLAKKIAHVQSKICPLDPELCVNPKRQHLKTLLKRKMRDALK